MNTAELHINKILGDTLVTYFLLKKKGQHELAREVLVSGSSIAKFLMTVTKLKETYHKGVYCPTCRKSYTDRDNIISIQRAAQCLSCDHLYLTTEEYN